MGSGVPDDVYQMREVKRYSADMDPHIQDELRGYVTPPPVLPLSDQKKAVDVPDYEALEEPLLIQTRDHYGPAAANPRRNEGILVQPTGRVIPEEEIPRKTILGING
jgi:hypothetical protein